MNKKYFILPICIGIIITLLLLFYDYEDDGAKVVYKLPEGFVSLHDLNERADRILKMLPFEDWNQEIAFCVTAPKIEFVSSCIFQTPASNSDYFVSYKNELYINEAKYMNLVEAAAYALEQHQRTYNLGEEVEVIGETVYKVKIISVEAIETEPCGTDSCVTYHIKYAITPNITEERQSLFAKIEIEGRSINIGDYEDYIECNGHNCIDKETLQFSTTDREYLIVRSGGPTIIDKETVSVKIENKRKEDKVEAIILRSPHYNVLEYRINVVGTENAIHEQSAVH
jgi:hypothetical protein